MAISLTYSTYSVTLRSADLGDILRFSDGAVKRPLKGGLPKIFKDPSWPVIEIRQFSFTGLTETQITAFRNLYKAAIGLSVTLVESYGVALTGFIMNPTIEILEIRDTCWYDLEFEYLCTLVAYQTGDCLTADNYDTITPVPGQSNFHSTLENDTFYQLLDEATGAEQLQSEVEEDFYGENF